MIDDLWTAAAQRDAALASVSTNAGAEFRRRASDFILDHLRMCGPCSSETLSTVCEIAGIIPHDARAFGPVIKSLSVAGKIRKAGTCLRTKGHLTTGGIVWEIV